MSYTYGSIKTKIRNITGNQDTDQLSNSDLGTYIDNFYTVTLPNVLKTDEMLQPYSYRTENGTDKYDFPSSTFYTVTPVAWADGLRLFWYTDQNLFYTDYARQYQNDDLEDGDGVTVTFTGTLDYHPLIKGSLIIFDGTETFTDDGSGVLTGDAGGTGTITYSTGAYSVTFNAAPSSSVTVEAKYEPYTAGQPQIGRAHV